MYIVRLLILQHWSDLYFIAFCGFCSHALLDGLGFGGLLEPGLFICFKVLKNLRHIHLKPDPTETKNICRATLLLFFHPTKVAIWPIFGTCSEICFLSVVQVPYCERGLTR